MLVGQHVRQGDVLFLKMSNDATLPEGVKPQQTPAVVALGELTGHSHQFLKDVILLDRESGVQEIFVPKPTNLVHEEHTAIMFSEGKFRRGFQVEDFGEEIRQVAD